MRLETLSRADPLIPQSEGFSSSLSFDFIEAPEELLEKDLWGFGDSWTAILNHFSTVEALYAAFQERYEKIEETKEEFRKWAVPFPGLSIEPNLYQGISGSYFLLDERKEKLFLIKPLDEEAGCIHSSWLPTLFTNNPIRSSIPLYQSPMREVLASRIADLIGVGSVVPKTVFGIFESDRFFDFSSRVDQEELKRYFDFCSLPNQEKLCSVQEYVPESKTLFEALHELQMLGLSDEEIESRFDPRSFEEANILLWTTYDTDGHGGNFLVCPRGTDELGNEILSLKKIDNGLSFPNQNKNLINHLSYLPNGKNPLSDEGKKIIEALDPESLAAELEQLGLHEAIPALKQRIEALQKFAKQPNITIKEINTAMANLGKKL